MGRKNFLYGKGINDASYCVSDYSTGEQIVCPYYKRWYDMVKRCYSPHALKRMPSYERYSVCQDWLRFSNFKVWMECQNWSGQVLDKDIVIPGNVNYSPESCVFIPEYLNLALVSVARCKGVSYHKRSNMYYAVITRGSVKSHLGSFHSEFEAVLCYIEAKWTYLEDTLNKYLTEQDHQQKVVVGVQRIIDNLKLEYKYINIAFRR